METGLMVFLIITTIIMSLGLFYLIYNIVKTKLLFKSALKASYKSIFALTSLTFLYVITFALWNSNIMFQNKIMTSTDNLVAESNFHQVTIDSDNIQEKGKLTNVMINKDKWITELGPTMEEMYPTSPNQPFNTWDKVQNQVTKQQNEDIQLPSISDKPTNTFYYKEFLDIWMYQNANYKGQEGQTLPYLEFGYNELATLELVIPSKEIDGEDLNALAFRMNPIDEFNNIGVDAPIPNFEDNKQIPNELLLKEGTLPDASDKSIGNSEANAAQIGILRSFGEFQDYPIGSTINAKVESDDFVGSPIDQSDFHGEVTGYIEHSALTFFNASNTSIMPDFTQQTIMAIPYDAFNHLAASVSTLTHPKYEINISFSDDVQYLKDGGSVEDFGTSWNNDNQEEFIKTISTYFKKLESLEFYDEVNNTPEQNKEAIYNSTAKHWDDYDNEFSTGIGMTYGISETNKLVTGIINSIFLGINIIFIFMVLKRKVMSQSKQIGVFKSLGYNSREISSSFIVNIFIIVIFGGFLSILFAFPLVGWLEGMFISTSIGMEMLATQLSVLVFLISIVIPFILISLVVWFFLNIMLKKPPTALLNDTTANKPNFLVRGSTVITRHLTFTNAYATKNGIRAMGKSFVTFASIFFSTTLLLFGILVSGFSEKAQESTFELMNYESHAYNEERVATLNKDQIDIYGSNYETIDDAYTFGLDFDYSTYSPTGREEAYQSDLNDGLTNVWDEMFSQTLGYESDNLTHNYNVWQQEIVYYMSTKTISRDKTYIDVTNKDFIQSFYNTGYLVFNLSNSNLKADQDLMTKDLEYKIKRAPTYTLETEAIYGLSLQDVFLKMGMLIMISMDTQELEFNKILFDIYETGEEENGFNARDLYVTKINGVNNVFDIKDTSNIVELYSSSKKSYENSTFNFNSWNRNDDLNKTLLEYENNDPTVLPVLIDYPTSQLLKLETGDSVELMYGYMIEDTSAEKIPLKVEVIGIYETYMPIGWFSLSTEPASIKYSEIQDSYLIGEPDVSDMWYEHTDVFGTESLGNDLFKQTKETINKEYSCIKSNSFYQEEFLLINYTPIINYNLMTNLEPCFAKEIPKDYYIAMSDEGSSLMNQMLGIFVGFAYMIVFIILLVISNETIQGSKREVSTLKALGYKTRTMSKIVLFGQAGIMILSIFVALPFTVLVMNMITALLLSEAGMFFDLTPVFVDIAIVIGVVMIIVVLTYILGTIIYKHTSPLDSLQRD